MSITFQQTPSQRRLSGFGGPGGPSMRWSRIEYVCLKSLIDYKWNRATRLVAQLCYKITAHQTDCLAKEYELAEEEVKISLDRFRDEYCNPDGSIK
jgi:hypothetical protein